MQDSEPLRYSGIAGGEVTARLTWQVIFVCTLLVGRPFWIIRDPFGGGYPPVLLFGAGAIVGFDDPTGGGGGAPWAMSPGAGPNPGFSIWRRISVRPSLSFWNSRQSLRILLVNVEVDGVGTRQLVVCRGFVVTAATLPCLCGASSIVEVASVVSSTAAVAIVALIGIASRNH